LSGLTFLTGAAITLESIPKLETQRLQLRAIHPSDARGIFEVYSDPKVAQFYDFDPYTTMNQSHQLIERLTYWFQNDVAYRWAMISKTNGELVGTCCLDTFHPAYQRCNLGYNVRSSEWGRGYATEAVKKVIDYAFEHGVGRPINRIEAVTLVDNAASERVLEKLGFEKEGVLREYGFWKGKYHDMHMFSLLRGKVAN
jgi:ribosomal-protein-alanine N-acetyltransferase